MSRRVLFLPQNDSHAQTAAMLAPALAARGAECHALDLDPVFHQGTRPFLESMPVIDAHLASDRPFYRLSPRAQLRLVAAARGEARRWTDGFDAVVAFNDGALQRLVFVEARRRAIPIDLILDGMITQQDQPNSPRYVLRRVLRAVGRALEGSPAGSFFPSEVGLATVDRIHVAGEHSAGVLRSRGSRARSIVASGLPRWSDARTPGTPRQATNVLYLTGAFRWHDDPITGDAQEADVRELADACRRLGLRLAVRVHPRDEAAQYLGLPGLDLIDPRSETMTESIERSDLVLSLISTGLLEAVLLGVPTKVLAIHPDWARYARSFAADPVFAAIRDSASLRTALTEAKAGVSLDFPKRQQAAIAPYVAATGNEATARIVSAITAAWSDSMRAQ